MTFQYTNTWAGRQPSRTVKFNGGEVVKLLRGIFFHEKTLGSTNMKPEQMNPSKKEILFKNHANISVSMLISSVYKLEPEKKYKSLEQGHSSSSIPLLLEVFHVGVACVP